jgi:hypothetical protein
VRFETGDGGQLAATLAALATAGGGTNPFTATTDANGLAVAFWLPGANGPAAQTVKAVLEAGALRLGAFTNVDFNGRIVAPSQGSEPGIVVRRIRIGAPRQDLVLDSVVTPAVLLGGIEIEAAGPIDVATLRVNGPQQAVLSVSIGLPYPLTDDDQFFWPGNDTRQPVYGFTTLELASSVNVDNNSLFWTPAPSIQTWLRGANPERSSPPSVGSNIDRPYSRCTERTSFPPNSSAINCIP